MNRHLAADVAAVARQQPGLQGEERCRRGGANSRTGRDTGVRVEPARHVEGENRNAAAVDAFDQRRVVRRKRPREADAEQTVDDQRSAPSGRNVDHGHPARTDEGAMRVARVHRQMHAVAAKDDGHVEE